MAGGRVAPWLVVACVWGLSACGGGGEVAEETPVAATEPAPAPTPTPEPEPVPAAAPAPEAAPASVTGGDSPDDAIARLRAAAEARDLGAVFAVVEPTERTGMLVLFGLMPGLFEQMAPGLEQQSQAEGFAGEMAAMMLKGLNACVEDGKAACARHKVELPSAEELGIDLRGSKPDPAEIAAKAGDRVAHVDVAAFVNDMARALDRFQEAMPAGMPKQSTFDQFASRAPVGELVDCVIEGDAARGMVNGKSVRFVRVNGRWYVRLTDVGEPAEEQPEMDPEPEGGGDEGMGGGKDDEEDKGGG